MFRSGQIIRALDHLADESGRYRSLLLLLGVGGLRWGEAAALRVGDVDFLRRRVELHRNAVMVGDRVIVGTLKSRKGRTVALPRFVTDALSVTAATIGAGFAFSPMTAAAVPEINTATAHPRDGLQAASSRPQHFRLCGYERHGLSFPSAVNQRTLVTRLCGSSLW